MNLAKYSLDNTKIIYFFLAVLLIGGITSFGKLGKKEDAPFVIKSAVIMTRYPGAEPAEVERLITEPISREIQSMSGVYKIKSESMYGLSKITFELQPSLSASSIPQKWDELRRKVLNIQPQLPSGASTPTGSDDFGDDNVVAYDDGLTAVQALNNGQVDAVVIDNAPAQEFIAANPGLKILDTSYAEEDYAIGMAKGSSLEDAVNAALEELKADGTLQAIVDKYITAE